MPAERKVPARGSPHVRHDSVDTPEENTSPPAAPATSLRQEIRHEVTELVKLVGVFLVIFIGLKMFVLEGYEVQGPSMEPTFQDRDRILVWKLPHQLSQLSLFSWLHPFAPQDIVVFDSTVESNKRYIKRVIAVGPGSWDGSWWSRLGGSPRGPIRGPADRHRRDPGTTTWFRAEVGGLAHPGRRRSDSVSARSPRSRVGPDAGGTDPQDSVGRHLLLLASGSGSADQPDRMESLGIDP